MMKPRSRGKDLLEDKVTALIGKVDEERQLRLAELAEPSLLILQLETHNSMTGGSLHQHMVTRERWSKGNQAGDVFSTKTPRNEKTLPADLLVRGNRSEIFKNIWY